MCMSGDITGLVSEQAKSKLKLKKVRSAIAYLSWPVPEIRHRAVVRQLEEF